MAFLTMSDICNKLPCLGSLPLALKLPLSWALSWVGLVGGSWDWWDGVWEQVGGKKYT